MTAVILPFPGCAVRSSGRQSKSLPRLHGRQKALLVQQDDDGYFALRLAPVDTPDEAEVEIRFTTHAEVAATAAGLCERYPNLYRFVIDEVAA